MRTIKTAEEFNLHDYLQGNDDDEFMSDGGDGIEEHNPLGGAGDEFQGDDNVNGHDHLDHHDEGFMEVELNPDGAEGHDPMGDMGGHEMGGHDHMGDMEDLPQDVHGLGALEESIEGLGLDDANFDLELQFDPEDENGFNGNDDLNNLSLGNEHGQPSMGDEPLDDGGLDLHLDFEGDDMGGHGGSEPHDDPVATSHHIMHHHPEDESLGQEFDPDAQQDEHVF